MIETDNLTISSAARHLKNGDFSATELADTYLKRISEQNGELNAFLEIFDDVKNQAAAAQKKIEAGEATTLTGIPLAIKDNILIKGRRASAASKILEGYKASYDAAVIEKLNKGGVVYLGRANMDEFAMGSSTENSAFGPVKNPHDSSRVSGGSSGGSAVAVSAGLALAGLGSDTGGSIRQPASFCGVVGLKTTYGRVSRHGLIAMGSSLDQIGPLAKTVTDAEIIYKAISGRDPRDSTSISEDTYSVGVKKSPIIGIPRQVTEEKGLDSAVLKNFKDSLEKLKGLGYKMKDIGVPDPKDALATYYIIMPAEVSSNMARYDGVRFGLHKDGKDLIDDYFLTRGEGLGDEVRRRIILGTYVLSTGYADEYYYKANSLRSKMRADYAKLFDDVDIIITPTAPTPAFKIGEKTKDPLEMYLADIFTVTANVLGTPALSVPSGFAETEDKKLPLGLQFMAPMGGEEALFEIGKKFLGE